NVKLLTGKLTEGVCPIGMPVLIENRDRWRDYFYLKGFGLRSFWDLLPDDVQCFADSVWVSRRVLVLPVHEDLSSKQRARLVDEFSNI
ncbi:MAG: hypothetical protein ACE5FU_04165, partial [Nitrospinota bacterium]